MTAGGRSPNGRTENRSMNGIATEQSNWTFRATWRSTRKMVNGRQTQSWNGTDGERRSGRRSKTSHQEQSNRSYFGHVAPLRYRTHTVGCWWRKAFECEGRMAAAEKPKMNTYQTVSVWAIALRSDRVGAPSALFLPRWRKP